MYGKKDSVSDNAKKIYKVFVSSTYLDNVERRKVVQDAILRAGMVWHGMEIFEASTRPVVEECLRHAREADVLVGIIAHRYGWEPDGVKSITEMEYDANKERLMFLIDQKIPVNPQIDFDEGPDKWKKQEKLEAFKKRIPQDQMPAIFNETTLSGIVLDSLNKWREKKEGVFEEKGRAHTDEIIKTTPDLGKEIQSYCLKAASLHEKLPVAGFATHIKVPIYLEDIFVPLRAMVNLQGVNEESFRDAEHAEQILRGHDSGLEISLIEAFCQAEKRRRKGIVILGDPGSGKTTHLKRLLLWCIRKGNGATGIPENILPVFLSLRELKNFDQGLDAFIQEQLQNPHLNTPEGFCLRLLERGNLLFLLDGLDEVAELSAREQVAVWVKQAVLARPTCLFVVTCCFAGYSTTVRGIAGNYSGEGQRIVGASACGTAHIGTARPRGGLYPEKKNSIHIRHRIFAAG